jgi:hypothetical protein
VDRVADGEQTIGQFLTELSDDPDRLEAYFEDPAAVVLDSGLSEEDQKLILSGDMNRIGTALSEEFPDEDFLERKPVKAFIPWPLWPILRPVKRVDY